MPPDISIHLTGNDELDLELIEKEISGSILVIFAYIILIISADQARQSILENAEGMKSSSGSQSAELAAFGSGLVLLSNIILGEVAFARLKELQDSIEAGTSTLSIIPNLNISTGYSFTILGNMFKSLGAFQRVAEQAQTTIL